MGKAVEGLELLERMREATGRGLVLTRKAERGQRGNVRAVVDGELRAMTKDEARAAMRAGEWLPAGETRTG